MTWRLLLVALLIVCTTAETLRFFVHVPKTGGTTFRHIFAQDCARTWTFLANSPGTVRDASLVRAMRHENYTCFQGHMTWELVEAVRAELPDCVIETFVLLRDPIARLISQYYYEQVLTEISYAPEVFFPLNANVVSRYLGADALDVVQHAATHVGLTEYYHETLSYLLAVGFLRNYNATVDYSTRKVHQRAPTADVRQLAIENTREDQQIYAYATARFFDEQLTRVNQSDVYARALRDLNTRPHACKNDEAGIGSGRCW